MPKIYRNEIEYTQAPAHLGELQDVTITTPSSGQVLAYDGSNWTNSSALRWRGAGAFVINNSTTSITVTQDLADINEILIGLYIDVGTIGTKIRKTYIAPSYELKSVGLFVDEMMTANDRMYFQVDYTDSTHLALSSVSTLAGYTCGIKVYVR